MYLHEPNLAPRTLMQYHRVSSVVLDDFLSPDFNVAKYKATELTEYVFYYTVFSLQKRVVWRDLKEFPQHQSLVNAPQQ